jgi:hypothetical protein
MKDRATIVRIEFLKKQYEKMPQVLNPNYVSPTGMLMLDDVVVYLKTSENLYAKKPFWKILIADLLSNVDIWQRDKDGNIKLGEGGLPKLNFVKLMFNLGKVLSYVLILIKESSTLDNNSDV